MAIAIWFVLVHRFVGAEAFWSKVDHCNLRYKNCDIAKNRYLSYGKDMNPEERIVIDPHVLVGKPVVKGTRLAVEFIIDLLAQGWAEAEILKNYPGLTHEDIQACLKYASASLHTEKVYPLPA